MNLLASRWPGPLTFQTESRHLGVGLPHEADGLLYHLERIGLCGCLEEDVGYGCEPEDYAAYDSNRTMTGSLGFSGFGTRLWVHVDLAPRPS